MGAIVVDRVKLAAYIEERDLVSIHLDQFGLAGAISSTFAILIKSDMVHLTALRN